MLQGHGHPLKMDKSTILQRTIDFLQKQKGTGGRRPASVEGARSASAREPDSAQMKTPFSQASKTSREDMNLSAGQNKGQQLASGNELGLNTAMMS